MDESEQHNQNSYVAQLHQVFASCDSSGTGHLGRSELTELCSQLHLDDQVNLITEHLLGDDPEAKVDFDEFKDKFVFLLAHSVDNDDQSEEESIHFSSPEREVSPKYVWGSKKYGRRSRPELDSNDTDQDFHSDFSDSEVFIDRPSGECAGLESPPPGGIPGRSRVPLGSQAHPGAKKRRRMRSSEDKPPSLESIEISLLDSSEGAMDGELGGRPDSPAGGNNGESEEEYLKTIWLKLGVGSDGFLNQDGLTRVCEHIGMEKMSEEVITQLFEKLDVDQDGMISFEEFLHLFRNGESTSTCSSASAANTVINTNAKSTRSFSQQSLSSPKERNSSTHNSTSGVCESGIFSNIDLENTGYAESDAIVELWDSLGVSKGYRILREFGFNTSAPICLSDLSNYLEDILQNPSDSEFTQIAFVTYNHELKFLRKSIDQMVSEREKLRNDVTDANARATLLAQEVDDHHANMEKSSQKKIMNLEKKYQDQIRRLQEDLEHEREQMNAQITKIKDNQEEEVATLKDAEARVNEQLILLQKENQNLEEEIRRMSQKFSEVQKINHQQQIEAESMLAMKQEFSYEEQCKAMAAKLETYKTQNKQLKDQNDEMNAEIEVLKQQLLTKVNIGSSACKGTPDANGTNDGVELAVEESGQTIAEDHQHHRRNGSWLSDYIKVPTIKRRGSGSTLTSSTEGMSEEGGCNLSGSLSCRRSELEGPECEKMATDGQNPSPAQDTPHLSSPEALFEAVDWSDDEEYLQLHSPTPTSLVTQPDGSGRVQPLRPDLEGAVKKLEIKKVFGILKKRFIEGYLEDVDNRNGVEKMSEIRISFQGETEGLEILHFEKADGNWSALQLSPCSAIEEPSLEDNNVAIVCKFDNSEATDASRTRKPEFSRSSNVNEDFDPNFATSDHETKTDNIDPKIKIGQDETTEDFDLKDSARGFRSEDLNLNFMSAESEKEMMEDKLPADVEPDQTDHSLKKQDHLRRPSLFRQSNIEVLQGVYSEELKAVEIHWKNLLHTERTKWESLIENMNERYEELKENFTSKEMSFKKEILKKEEHWREQVERERADLEKDKDDLENKIAGLEFKLQNAKRKRLQRMLRKDRNFDVEISSSDDGAEPEDKMEEEKPKGSSLKRSTSVRTKKACHSHYAKRNGWINARNNIEAIEVDSSFGQDTDSDLDFGDESDGGKEIDDNGAAQGQKLLKHKMGCCSQSLFYETRLKNVEKQKQSLERELRRIRHETLLAQTSMEGATSLRLSNGDKNNCIIDVEVLMSINRHLKQEENRCRQLEATLQVRTSETERALKESRQTYDEEIRRISWQMQKQKALLKEEVKDKNEKLLQADILVKDLYLENAHLMKSLQFLEEKNHKTEKANITLQQKCQALNQLLSEMCRSAHS